LSEIAQFAYEGFDERKSPKLK